MTPLTAIDLFAGAGGLGEGLAQAGFHVVVAQELHPQPALTYAFNHPDTYVMAGDIHDVTADHLRSLVVDRTGRERVDLVAGGPPCQGFSTAGSKQRDDPRNDLFKQFMRVVEGVKPSVVLLENVPGFKKMYRGRAFEAATSLLDEMGYECDDRLVRASNFGVPQRRERFVLVAWRRNESVDYQWPTEALVTQPPDGQLRLGLEEDVDELPPVVTASDALDDIAYLEPGLESHAYLEEPTTVFQKDRRAGGAVLFNHLATRHRDKTAEMFSHIPQGGTIAAVPDHLRTAKRTMARMHPDEVSNAVVSLPDDFIHYAHDRICTVREMARLQSFDDDYVFFGRRTTCNTRRRSDVPQYTQVGNAVPPLLGKSLGFALARALGETPTDVRDLTRRAQRHEWVRGTSAYAGYGLDPEAESDVRVHAPTGRLLDLPFESEEPLARELESPRDWTSAGRPSRSDWDPEF